LFATVLEVTKQNNNIIGMTKITVVGLGAMGGGMARSLLRCDSVNEVSGFDLNPEVVSKFYAEAKQLGKVSSSSSSSSSSTEILTLDRFVDKDTTDVVLIVLVNEAQCQSICFENNGINLESLLRSGTTVIVSSTVTPAWSKRACSRFNKKGINFLDCPVSGGPVRALSGEITIMASGDEETLKFIDPLFQAMGKEIHIVKGGAGMGSTVKMVHQLLAGVHIAVAAEALALAAKAGLDVHQLYDIVKGAAGASWMFCDRGARMIEYTGENPDQEKVMSSLAIFIKDMDIVYSSAKELRCPVPIATAALQQFIGGSGLGLDKKDDSQVVKVYETLYGVSVSASSSSPQPHNQSTNDNSSPPSVSKVGDNVGDTWILPDGTKEKILEVADEPHHHLVISNEYTKVMRGRVSPKHTAWAHKHSEDSVYFFLADGGLDFVNHVKGCDPACDRVEFGEVVS
jgi:putative dehydrogenase